MIELNNIKVYGFEEAIKGMRNPMNSWDKSDSHMLEDGTFLIGDKDLSLAKKLSKAGPVHGKYKRMIVVYMDITAPLYWWKEFDTYKVGTVANSCSTMHKIHEKKFEMNDFSYEHLYFPSLRILSNVIEALNDYREKYILRKDKEYWWQMIQLLPSSYNQKRTVMLNYEVLSNIYESRKGHKLDEWNSFISRIKDLPYSFLITNLNEEKNTKKVND